MSSIPAPPFTLGLVLLPSSRSCSAPAPADMNTGDVCRRRLDGVEFEVKLLRTYGSGDCWDIEYLDGNTEEAVPVAELVVKESNV